MGYSISGHQATDILVESGTDDQLSNDLNTDVGDDNSQEIRLVLNDPLNLHAVIIQGTPAELVDLGEQVLHVAHRTDGWPAEARKVLTVVLAEIEANLDHSDSHTAADIAADVTRKLSLVIEEWSEPHDGPHIQPA